MHLAVLYSNLNECSVQFKTFEVTEKPTTYQKIDGGKPIKKHDIGKLLIKENRHDKIDVLFYSLAELQKNETVNLLKEEMRNHYRRCISESERAYGNISRIQIKG